MQLELDTVKNNATEISVRLTRAGQVLAAKQVSAETAQSEKLLPLIQEVLDKQGFVFQDIDKIEVNNQGGSFTALRIGVVTANALAYALGIPVSALCQEPPAGEFGVVKPAYDKEPNINLK